MYIRPNALSPQILSNDYAYFTIKKILLCCSMDDLYRVIFFYYQTIYILSFTQILKTEKKVREDREIEEERKKLSTIETIRKGDTLVKWKRRFNVIIT